MQIPKPGVPQIMTMEGKFVRAAYNNEGYVILGYQPANRSVGEEWMLLEIGVTLRDNVPDFKLTRDALSLETPDGKTLPLPSVSEHRAGNTACAAESGEGPARLDQLLSAEREPGVPHRFLLRSGLSRDGVGRGRVELRPRLHRPALFPRAGRHQVWPALAQREVREESRARAIPHPDRGRREDAVEELQGHQPAGQRRVQEEMTRNHCYMQFEVAESPATSLRFAVIEISGAFRGCH